MSASDTSAQAAMVADILKLARSEWMSRGQIARHIGSKPETVAKWVAEFVAQGMLIERIGTKGEGVRGHCPMVYALAPEWGGKAGGPSA